jgi:ABC-type Fe3+/spermidine/putrescine transport system ATPase subunit
MAELTRDPPAVALRGLSVGYGSTPVLQAVDLEVMAGETVALLGPSGSGKTTLLYAVAGFLQPTGGAIEIAGRLVADTWHSVPPERRALAMVFQHYGLWPHLDALDTVAYPLRRAGLPAAEARAQARQLLGRMRIEHLAARRPAELSGGEQQRVGLARALARRPHVYLLDEPTAHLDTPLRAELQEELSARRRSDGAAAIHATHDVEEALALADRVALLRDGTIVQLGTPAQVYEQPIDEPAARLTGPASVVELEGRRSLVRPDWVTIVEPAGQPRADQLAARVDEVRYRGTHTDYLLATPLGPLLARQPGAPRLAASDPVRVVINRHWPLGTG